MTPAISSFRSNVRLPIIGGGAGFFDVVFRVLVALVDLERLLATDFGDDFWRVVFFRCVAAGFRLEVDEFVFRVLRAMKSL
jgi:hypothetical protein